MNKHHSIKIIGAIIVAAQLTACNTSWIEPGHGNHGAYYGPRGQLIYPEGYDQNYYNQEGQYANQPQRKKEVVVPETYHVGAYHSPTSHKNRDRNWVTRQNPSGYTIEVANDSKPSSVAKKLFQAPKSERQAEVKYQSGGQTRYKGLYGSYPNYEAAQEAMQKLPDDVKKGARIERWGSVQNNL